MLTAVAAYTGATAVIALCGVAFVLLGGAALFTPARVAQPERVATR